MYALQFSLDRQYLVVGCADGCVQVKFCASYFANFLQNHEKYITHSVCLLVSLFVYSITPKLLHGWL